MYIPTQKKTYYKTKRLQQTPEEVEKYFSGFLAFIHSIEQQIIKPADTNKRKIFYSGKKKRHTIKMQLMVNNRGYLHKLRYKKGRSHNYDTYKRHYLVISKQFLNVVDLRYLGIEKDFPKPLSALTCKKEKKQNLSQEEKEYNKIHSRKKDNYRTYDSVNSCVYIKIHSLVKYL